MVGPILGFFALDCGLVFYSNFFESWIKIVPENDVSFGDDVTESSQDKDTFSFLCRMLMKMTKVS